MTVRGKFWLALLPLLVVLEVGGVYLISIKDYVMLVGWLVLGFIAMGVVIWAAWKDVEDDF